MTVDWTVWILASSIFLALYDLTKKASVDNNAVLPVLFISTCCGCAAYMASLAACGRLCAAAAGMTPEVVALSAVKCTVVSASWVLTFCALRSLPISIATPIRASSPALVFLIAFVLSVVITFVLGAKFFHETNLARKAVALAVVLAGIALICIGR